MPDLRKWQNRRNAILDGRAPTSSTACWGGRESRRRPTSSPQSQPRSASELDSPDSPDPIAAGGRSPHRRGELFDQLPAPLARLRPSPLLAVVCSADELEVAEIRRIAPPRGELPEPQATPKNFPSTTRTSIDGSSDCWRPRRPAPSSWPPRATGACRGRLSAFR